MNHKYGEFSEKQIQSTKQSIRKQIFFLLLIVDPNTKDDYKNIDVNAAYDGFLSKLGGLNTLLREPPELVEVMSLLQSAWAEYNSPDFTFAKYRRLVLSAGSEIQKIKEV